MMTAQDPGGKRHHFFGYSVRDGRYYVRTLCGRVLRQPAIRDNGPVAFTEPDVCQNCVRVIGVVGDGKNDLP